VKPSRTCPGCEQRTATHPTVRPGLRLCADCWAVLVRLIREGRRVER
jgi:hypothetical protein